MGVAPRSDLCSAGRGVDVQELVIPGCPHLPFMPAESNTRNVLCTGCDQTMALVQTIPQSGVLSEIVVFYCERCKQAETIAEKRAA